MDREEALRKLQATTAFTFVGDKVLLRQASVLQAAAEIQSHMKYTAHPSEFAVKPAYILPAQGA